jgi:GNAT superfamily N-acetyltransferase
MGRRHVREPHHYFPSMGVAQSAQGKGLGTLLMTPTFGRCDEARLPAYLEATSCAARRDLKPDPEIAQVRGVNSGNGAVSRPT